MFDAAGIVVTEIRTPISAPDFALVRERIPTVPATKATKKEKKSGSEMKPVSVWSERTNSSGLAPVHLKTRVAAQASAIPAGKPTPSAASERRARSGRRWTSATDRPA